MDQKVIIEFPDSTRARCVVRRSNYRPTGKYPGYKSRRMHQWESQLEADAFRRLDADPGVIHFAEQPVKLTFPDGAGKTRIHYPDLLVRFPGRQEFVEVKPDKDAASDDVVSRADALRPLLASEGYGYRIWRESEIRQNHKIPNIRFLLRHGRQPVPLDRFESIRKEFARSARISWHQVTVPSSRRHSLNDVARLVLDGRLDVDLDRPIEDDSIVTLVGGAS